MQYYDIVLSIILNLFDLLNLYIFSDFRVIVATNIFCISFTLYIISLCICTQQKSREKSDLIMPFAFRRFQNCSKKFLTVANLKPSAAFHIRHLYIKKTVFNIYLGVFPKIKLVQIEKIQPLAWQPENAYTNIVKFRWRLLYCTEHIRSKSLVTVVVRTENEMAIKLDERKVNGKFKCKGQQCSFSQLALLFSQKLSVMRTQDTSGIQKGSAGSLLHQRNLHTQNIYDSLLLLVILSGNLGIFEMI